MEKVIDVLVLPLQHASTIEAGDLCYDKDEHEFFYAKAKQVPELRKVDSSFFKVVDNGIFKDITKQWEIHFRNVWMTSVHGSTDWNNETDNNL